MRVTQKLLPLLTILFRRSLIMLRNLFVRSFRPTLDPSDNIEPTSTHIHCVELISTHSITLNNGSVSGIDCGLPPPVYYSFRQVAIKTTADSSVNIACMSGYWFRRGVYSAAINCTSKGTWQPVLSHCKGLSLERCHQMVDYVSTLPFSGGKSRFSSAVPLSRFSVRMSFLFAYFVLIVQHIYLYYFVCLPVWKLRLHERQLSPSQSYPGLS